MIHVVLAPNVLVEGLGWRDSPASTVVEAALRGRFVPVTSASLLDETEALLCSRPLRRGFPRAGRLLELVAAMSMVVEPQRPVREQVKRQDRLALEAAQAAEARFLVTRSLRLLQLGRLGPTRMVRPS
jgi:putative PIN family toxin of toxin-antitoxin system